MKYYQVFSGAACSVLCALNIYAIVIGEGGWVNVAAIGMTFYYTILLLVVLGNES